MRDNGGRGGDLSPAAGSAPSPGEPVSIITSSAWQWCYDDLNTLEIDLKSAPNWCLTNNNGNAVMRPCRNNLDQQWELTGSPFHLHNFGSDYLCAEGASDAAILPLSGCTNYRETWGIESNE